MHVAEAKRKLGSRIPWICDSISNDLKHALGNAPNSEFIIGPDGKILTARRWSSPSTLRDDLAELVGRVESPTTVADIGMQRLEPPKTAKKGVVPRVQLPGRMTPILVEAVAGEEPFYAKLRAEMTSGDSGKLYIGFFLDPLYKVHWNNRAAPLEFTIEPPEDVEISPATGKGPDVEADADADPREFLLELSGRSNEPFKLTVKYFACDDAETFCKPVTQQYLITLRPDRDGGSRRSSRSRGGSFRGRPSPSPPRRPGNDAKTSRSLRKSVALFKKHDANRDGSLDKSEWSAIDPSPGEADTNSDGGISLRELIDWLK